MHAIAPFTPGADDLARAAAFLRARVEPRLRPGGAAWLDEAMAAARTGALNRTFLLFSTAWRHAPKEPLAAPPEEAHAVRPRWRPGDGTVLDGARALVVMSLDAGDPDRWLAALDALFRGADLAEAVALHRALPVLPRPDLLVARCAEGVRSNVTSVFTAVAHGNPFPAERLDEGAWNQMVLKALFVGVPLDPVIGLDERANPALARMLTGFSRERRAAGRPVPADLWRCVGPHADGEAVAEMSRAAAGEDAAEAAAARAALKQCPRADARAALEARTP